MMQIKTSYVTVGGKCRSASTLDQTAEKAVLALAQPRVEEELLRMCARQGQVQHKTDLT